MTKRILLLLAHFAAGGVSLWFAFLFRFELNPRPEPYAEMERVAIPLAMMAKGLAAFLFALHRHVWRFASFRDVQRITGAAALGTLLFGAAVYSLFPRFPRGPLLLDFLFTFTAFAVLRFSGRLYAAARRRDAADPEDPDRDRVLIIGNGRVAEAALRMLWQGRVRRANVRGFVAENPGGVGELIHGVPVLGGLDDVPDLLLEHRIRDVVLALEDSSQSRVRSLYVLAAASGCKVRILTPQALTLRSDSGENPIRRLNLADLLGRPPVELDPSPVRAALSGRRVLVTGAGGSIGSELSRQLAALPVARLILLDLSENALFEITEELQARSDARVLDIELCDIRDRRDLERVFRTHRPEIVFHAAACKHVSMMERHPVEAVKTNVFGTRTLLETARDAGVERFLHVSTDKAVDAVGVMGASKALGEQLVLSFADGGGMTCSCVRFGNVLGSSGSVIPLFEKQLRRGGPLQVTHEEATRYFMTLEEAVLLMLQAEALRENGRIYVLDMGEPVSILSMARQIGDLHEAETGLRPGLKIVGLRPGEKLHETLVSAGQGLEPTPVPKVNTLQGGIRWDAKAVESRLAVLADCVARQDAEGIRDCLLRRGEV